MQRSKSYKSKSFPESLSYAVRGIALAFFRESNMRRQVVMLLAVAVLAWWLKMSPAQFLVLLSVSVAVLALELINSSVEALADAVHPDYDERIERAKDMAAGAVLVVSAAAAIVGLSIFLPVLVERYYFWIGLY